MKIAKKKAKVTSINITLESNVSIHRRSRQTRRDSNNKVDDDSIERKHQPLKDARFL
jgi:hypothetical protein